MLTPNTLTFRLVVTSTLWVAATLLIAGLLLVGLFRAHIERRFDLLLQDDFEELVAASEVGSDGKLMLGWAPADPRFHRPRSGWYWQILRDGEAVAQSESLWLSRLDLSAPPIETGAVIQELEGPGGHQLRAFAETVTLPQAKSVFGYVVAGPVQDIERDVERFSLQLGITLSVLGLGLIGVVVVQVRFGLRPLRLLRAALADIRAGRLARLPEVSPQEVSPVVAELNALLDHNSAMLERARSQAEDLAHALKNPLTVIRNEVGELEGERSEILRDQIAAIGTAIKRHLARARAAGTYKVPGTHTSVAAVVEDLCFSMELLYKERGITLAAEHLDSVAFRGDRHDLEEMLGNLMDNACKWAHHQIWVSAARINGHLRIRVEDDGPGVPEERLTEICKRGQGLDEATHGSGLGLSIVQELAGLYDGGLSLGKSKLGGLCAELDLPACE